MIKPAMYLGVVPDVLPLAPRPVPGELRSSWLIRVASANALTLRELIDAIVGRHPAAGVDRAFFDDVLPDSVAMALAQFTRLPASIVRSLAVTGQLPGCLASWILRRPLLQVDGQERVSDQRAAYAFCPACLASSGPAYLPVEWACAVVTHCPTHHTRLLDQCPACFVHDPFAIGVGNHPDRAECWQCEAPLGLATWRADRSVAVEPVLRLQSALVASFHSQPSPLLDPTGRIVASLLDLLVDDDEPPFARVAALHWPHEFMMVGRQLPESRFAYLPVRVRFLVMACAASVVQDDDVILGQRLVSVRHTLATSLAEHEWQRWEQHAGQWPARVRAALVAAREP